MSDVDGGEDDFFTHKTTLIVGLGLMGGSLVMALKPHCFRLFAVDPDPAVIQSALEQGVIDGGSTSLGEIVSAADLVILAAPVRAIIGCLEALPHLHAGTALVMDVGSTKVEITRAMEQLPERFDPLGGHPMCGKEKLTFSQAEPGLFRGAPFAFTPIQRTSERACQIAEQLCRLIGARAVWLSPGEHDSMVASTSHLPYLISSILVSATSIDAAVMVGPGFRGMARLAATPSEMMLDVLATNREKILSALTGFREEMERVSQLLMADNEEELKKFLHHGNEKQEKLVR